MRWLMRLLAIAGLGIALFLLFVHIAAHWAAARATVPFCSGLSWLDCESVLNSRYAQWIGVPTSLLAAMTYLVMTIALLAMSARRSAQTMRRLWWIVIALATSAAIAAAWFVYLQVAVLGRLCSYCMVEHLVGVMLAMLAWLHVGLTCRALRRVLPSAAVVGVIGAAALVAGQMFIVPRYTHPITWKADADRWVEPGEPADLFTMSGGNVVLDRRAHPTLGLPGADRVIVDVLDFTCKRCRMAERLLVDARPYLPPDIAVIVIFAPQSSDCNPEIINGNPHYVHACAMVKLAVAVWLADPSRYAEYHHWLFEHQKGLLPETAQREAERLVGEAPLARALADPRVDQLIRRDLQLAQRLAVGQLPGLIVNDQRFTAIPEEATELARALRRAMGER